MLKKEFWLHRKKTSLSDVTVTKLSLNVNVDGLPLFHSSNVQLWPIQCSISELAKPEVFIIGLCAGLTKPSDVTTFLHDFV